MIITLDGPAGSGKSTVAQILAQRLGWTYLKTGMYYRAVALAGLRHHVDWDQPEQLVDVAKNISLDFRNSHMFLDHEDVTELVETLEITAITHYAASNPGVREILTEQHRLYAKKNNCVTEGRDQGTVVFPDALLKIYLDASAEERARRRFTQKCQLGQDASYEDILTSIQKRDAEDSSRPCAPLRCADDAIRINSDGLSIQDVTEKILELANPRIKKASMPEERPPLKRSLEPVKRTLRQHLFYHTLRLICRVFCTLYFRVSVRGREKIPHSGATLMVGNHQSYLDPILMGIKLGCTLNFLARDTLFKGLLGWIIRRLNTIPLERDGNPLAAMRESITRLKKGEKLVVFPEGTRTETGEMGVFHPGFVILAKRGKAAIQPFSISGAYRAMPRGCLIPRPVKIYVTYGDVISAEDVAAMTDEEICAEVKRRILDGIKK